MRFEIKIPFFIFTFLCQFPRVPGRQTSDGAALRVKAADPQGAGGERGQRRPEAAAEVFGIETIRFP